MKKTEFNDRPALIEYEGPIVRINFDVEKSVIPAAETPDSEGSVNGGTSAVSSEPRTVYLAYIARVPQPLTASAIHENLLSQGFPSTKAEEIAAYVMMTLMQEQGNTPAALEYAKNMVAARIAAYDQSDAVNDFTLNGDHIWLPDAKRTQLAKRFDTDEADGLSVTKVIYEGKTYTLPITTARVMLHALESYARDCFDVTNEHQAAVLALTDIAAVLAYDFTTGYPPNPAFGGDPSESESPASESPSDVQ